MIYSIVMNGCMLLWAWTEVSPASPVSKAAASVTPPDIVQSAAACAAMDTFLVLEAVALEVPEKAVLREPEYSLPFVLLGELYL
jgi:hypothetical protein